MTCIEEVDHGLHPQALELVVERLREASSRTQFLIATHSPAMADHLRPEELVVCERREDGSSVIPALDSSAIHRIVRKSEGLPLGAVRRIPYAAGMTRTKSAPEWIATPSILSSSSA